MEAIETRQAPSGVAEDRVPRTLQTYQEILVTSGLHQITPYWDVTTPPGAETNVLIIEDVFEDRERMRQYILEGRLGKEVDPGISTEAVSATLAESAADETPAIWIHEPPRKRRRIMMEEYRPDLHQTSHHPHLSELPMELLHAIFTQTDIKSMLRLTATSHGLRSLLQVDPRLLQGDTVKLSGHHFKGMEIVSQSVHGDIILSKKGDRVKDDTLVYMNVKTKEKIRIGSVRRLFERWRGKSEESIGEEYFYDIEAYMIEYLARQRDAIYWLLAIDDESPDEEPLLATTLIRYPPDLALSAVTKHFILKVSPSETLIIEPLYTPTDVRLSHHICSSGSGTVLLPTFLIDEVNTSYGFVTIDHLQMAFHQLPDWIRVDRVTHGELRLISRSYHDYRDPYHRPRAIHLGDRYFLLISHVGEDVTMIEFIRIQGAQAKMLLFFSLPRGWKISAATILLDNYLLMSFSAPEMLRGYIDVLRFDRLDYSGSLRIRVPFERLDGQTIRYLTSYKSALVLFYADKSVRPVHPSHQTSQYLVFFDLFNPRLRSLFSKTLTLYRKSHSYTLSNPRISTSPLTYAFLEMLLQFDITTTQRRERSRGIG